MSSAGKAIKNVIEELWNVLTDTENSEIFKLFSSYETNIGVNFDNSPERKYTMTFPYMMYYRMMGTTTTNLYEIPFNPQELYKT